MFSREVPWDGYKPLDIKDMVLQVVSSSIPRASQHHFNLLTTRTALHFLSPPLSPPLYPLNTNYISLLPRTGHTYLLSSSPSSCLSFTTTSTSPRAIGHIHLSTTFPSSSPRTSSLQGQRPWSPKTMPSMLESLVRKLWHQQAALRPPFEQVSQDWHTLSMIVSFGSKKVGSLLRWAS